ncbi:hypothetical protein L3Q82_004199 [Scortum barcoo]|uniref:Uncharacterized protein n=1 Tax=Scortum barcoo TaxID=214431 RepID=A0ACB8VJV7_9TELE|nr:hypothetical protein L3Q82_004199 [Scortum barcoo]
MTSGDSEEECGQKMRRSGGGNEANVKPPLSFTTLSTIAVQAGQTLLVVSVLKSGSLVHLQLVQVHPGLCEIGLNQEENQTLIQEQQQLMDKLKKHELEVLSMVDKSRQADQRGRRDEGMKEQRRSRKQEEEVHKAMVSSLKEGWFLLLSLLHRRQEVLTLAADFYSRALEFAVSIDTVEDLQIEPEDKLSEVQLKYESMRRDLLGKSLQVLSSSSILLQELRQLQRTEALQRRGGVLQDEEQKAQEESSQSSWCSRGASLRLEELVEMLQDRRRRADQALRLKLQRAENDIIIHEKKEESSRAGPESWSLTVDEILDQNLQSGSTSAKSTNLKSDLQPGSRAHPEPEYRLDVNPESRSEPTRDKHPGSRTEETINFESGSRSDLQSSFRLEFYSRSRPEETRNLQSGFKLDLMTGSRSDLKSNSKSEETRDLQPGSTLDHTPGPRSDLKQESKLNMKPRSEQTGDKGSGLKSDETRNHESGSRLDLKPESGSDLKPLSISEETKDLQPESRSEDTKDFQSKFKSKVKAGSGLNLKPASGSKESINLHIGSTSDLKSESTSNLKSGSILEQTEVAKFRSKSGESTEPPHGSRSDSHSDSRSEETSNIQLGFRSDMQPGSRLNLKSASGSDKIRDQEFGSLERKYLHPGSSTDLNPESRSEQTRALPPESRSQETTNLQPKSRSEESKNLNSGSRSEETRTRHSESTSEIKELRLESTPDVQPQSRSEQTKHCQSGSRSVLDSESRSDVELRSGSELQHGSGSEAEDFRVSELSRKQEVTKQHRAATTTRKTEDLGNDNQQALLTNQRRQLLSSCEHLVEKVWSWVQESSSVISNSSEPGQKLSEAEDTLNTHLQLHTQAESAGQDVENMKQIVDQIRALHSDFTSTTSPPSDPIRQPSSLKALTEQLKRGSLTRRTRPDADPAGPLSPELAARVDLVLKELQSLNRKIDSNLQLLCPYVTFLRTAQQEHVEFDREVDDGGEAHCAVGAPVVQVEQEMEELKEIYRERPQKEEEEEEMRAEINHIRTNTSLVKKKQDDVCWQETLQNFLTCEELGNNFINAVTMVSVAGLNLQSLVSVVQQMVERLSRTKQEVNKLLSQQEIQIQKQQEYCRKYRKRLLKAVQDMICVSELLDSCTLMDLGSDLQTSKLVEHFSQARPHFIQLDTEVEYVVKSWETLRGVQDRLEVTELKGRAVKEEDLSELLKLQEKVKNKIQQSESILDLTSSFHITSKQLEVLLCSDPASPSTGSCGSTEAELSRHKQEQQHIQSLFKTTSTLKTDICTAISQSGWTCFRVEQLEARLRCLDSLCVSWLNEAARREEKLRGDLLTCLLHDDISQDLKKHFSNLKFNYVKRNNRTRNMKAVRNQLQQVELNEEKLEVLRKRLQGVTARLGSEVRDGGAAREVEDTINELQRQMGEFGRSVSEHQKTLEMTCRLQQAMEEYQSWCEEASATIARVGKFSSECRSTEAVSVLYQQFEKFVWPTVPQQEERISQITELAVRLHGVDEGQRYIEKTVSKHSEVVESIRELSDGLMKLEAKLKLESLKQQQSGREKEIKEEEKIKRRTENETEEKKLKENRKMKKKEKKDNRSTQEAADMYELKETGHTPAEHDGKEVPMKRQTAANRKPPLQKSRSQEADRQTDRQADRRTDSRQQLYSERFTSTSTHTFSLSCSPVEANRRVHAIHSQLQPVASEPQAMTPPSVTGSSFSDIQRAFQRKEVQGTRQQVVSDSANMAQPQDASAGHLSEAELQQQEAMTEDSLSSDEYECASPDDISLPPLAETPESNIIQSDVEESFCFCSHSVHINQYSHQSDHNWTSTATGAVRQQKESSQSCPTPPTCLHSSSRAQKNTRRYAGYPADRKCSQAAADLKRGIKKAKQAYKLKVEEYFVYSDPRRMWQGIQAITDYKPSNSTQTVMNVSFLNELNDFYARFDKDNKDMTIKPKPSDYHQTLTLSPTDVQNALSQINARKLLALMAFRDVCSELVLSSLQGSLRTSSTCHLPRQQYQRASRPPPLCQC